MDVRHYVITELYAPFIQAKQERIKITNLSNSGKKNPYVEWSTTEMSNFNQKLGKLLADPSIKLDERIRDGRISDLIWLLWHCSNRSYISTDICLPVLKKGLLVDNFLAFELLHDRCKLEDCRETEPFVKRAIKILNATREWDDLDERCVRMIAFYCLTKSMYKPVWKWLTVFSCRTKNCGILFPYPTGYVVSHLAKLHEQFKQPYTTYLQQKGKQIRAE
jgi:hypothetical protein